MIEAIRRLGRLPKLSVRLAVLAALAVLALTACGTTSAPPPNLDLNPYTITFATEPAAPTAGGATKLRATITGKTPLSKRAEISFEVKKVGVDERTEVKAESKGQNLFEGEYTFKESGAYSITVHVITSRIHQVSNQEITVK